MQWAWEGLALCTTTGNLAGEGGSFGRNMDAGGTPTLPGGHRLLIGCDIQESV